MVKTSISKLELIELRARMAAELIAPRLAVSNANASLGEGKAITAKQAVEMADAILAEAIATQEIRWNADSSD